MQEISPKNQLILRFNEAIYKALKTGDLSHINRFEEQNKMFLEYQKLVNLTNLSEH